MNKKVKVHKFGNAIPWIEPSQIPKEYNISITVEALLTDVMKVISNAFSIIGFEEQDFKITIIYNKKRKQIEWHTELVK